MQRAWSVWTLLQKQWIVAPMGGLIGWAGYDAAIRLLTEGHRLRGEELLAEVDRLRVLEDAQIEIEQRWQAHKEDSKRKRQNAPETAETVQGDLSGFDEDDE